VKRLGEEPVPDHGFREWEQALHAYSAALDEQRSALLSVEADTLAKYDAVAPPGFVPPVILQPMPAALAPWARQLMEQTDGLLQLAGELATRSEPKRPARAHHAAAVTPVALDALL
jgi:hypothetical protein